MNTETAEIIRLIKASGKKIILLDGYCSTRKTSLAKEISAAMGIPHISLDELCHRNNTAEYIANIDYETFAHRMDCVPSCIIEGILVLEFLKHAEISLSDCFYIYAEVVDEKGDSVYHHYLFDIDNNIQLDKERASLDKRLEEVNRDMEAAEPISQEHNRLFDKKFYIVLEKYHYDYQPHRKADFVYKIVK